MSTFQLRIARTMLGCLAISMTLFSSAAMAGDQEHSIDRQIESFTLPDYLGRDVSLADFKQHQAIVVCFLGTECPLAKFYGPRLQALSQAMANRGVAFIGINANVQDSLTEIAGYARRHDIAFPILKDLRSQVAEQFGATRTPEVFLLDSDRRIRYQGRVDEQFTFGSGVGLAQPNATRADLKLAIEELLAGKPITINWTPAKGCLIGRAREKADQPTFTYSEHIAGLIQDHCQNCHRDGQIAPFALDSYDEVAGWGEMIAEVVREQRMPPWHAGEKSTAHFLNDARLSDAQKEMIFQWVEDGCPEGDPAATPPPRQFTSGWFTDEDFDNVVYIADQPVPVKAEGVEEYRYYEVPGVDHDRWVKTIECLPGNHSVVHHIIVYARPPGGEPIPQGSTGVKTRHFSWLGGFAPGTRPLQMPDGWVRMIPAGYSLVFEMHYTPIGTAQTDRSAIGLIYEAPEKVERVLRTSLTINTDFKIPPHAADHRVRADRPFERDTLVLALFPHMHVRGKSFRYELVDPDGQSQILLDVPHYDFNWQNSYTLAEPLLIRKGSQFRTTAHYDNSDFNLANPNPDEEVTWGEQSWDEMMIGFYDHGVTVPEARRLLAEDLEMLEQQRRERH
ncbi:redoxin domain-containing protein [Roseiconus nitratireducens]|nr:redoxin domain-containing protein [Roseiconus nitratireducens]